jgi:RHS repeat-associated protein
MPFRPTHHIRSAIILLCGWQWFLLWLCAGFAFSAQATHGVSAFASGTPFDAQGNITQTHGKTLVYAPDQRLSQINQGGNEIARYRYDAFGQRIGKTTQSGTTYYDYDPAGQLLNQSDTPANYVYLDGEPLARADYWPYDWSGSVQYWPIHYYHNNPVGAPLKTSSNYRNVTWNAQLDPFGKAQSINPTITQNLRFPGQYYDAETGWHYNMQRYYDPDTGRYLQSDPIGLRGGVNTYAYVGNNPLRYIDPLGLYTEVVVWNSVGIGSSSYGHISTNINDTNYSWGTGGWDTQYPSASQYNNRQLQFRGGSGVILNLTPQQEFALGACIKSHGGSYSPTNNNCGTPIQSCLDKVGAGVGNSVLPSNVLDNLRNSPDATGTTDYPDPRGNNSGSAFGTGLLWN